MFGNSVWVTWPTIAKLLGGVGVLVSLLILAVEREELLQNNLYDVETADYYTTDVECDEQSEGARTLDGTCVILDNPKEGSIYTKFGKNVNPNASLAELESGNLLVPNPREVSNLLMGRDEFKPATSLNFIAAAWIQFMTHDWFAHEVKLDSDPIRVPVPENDPEFDTGDFIDIKRTAIGGYADQFQTFDEENGEKVLTGLDQKLPTYENQVTHWWDGSQIYGVNPELNAEIRTFEGGKLKLDEAGFIPAGSDNVPVQGFTENWWVGLSMLHNLFVKEHNAIADAIAAQHPEMNDQQIYDKARLVNAALMAKIHTVEWTPAIIANPVTIKAMYANWFGLIGNRSVSETYRGKLEEWMLAAANQDGFFQRIIRRSPALAGVLDFVEKGKSLDYAVGGLAGAPSANNYGVPFTLTEEFVQVYRMHPLMRDTVDVYDLETGAQTASVPLQDTTFGKGEEFFRETNAADLWYGFGITNPGALTLKNYPNFLRNIEIPFRGPLDLATIDIVRDRERGIPRYNEFRRQIGLAPITTFEQLFEGANMFNPENQKLLADMKRVYNNDVELIDIFVGEMAESVRPEGFGFSETAFQIFIMNASRRILTDRFYTSDYNADTYTSVGIDWVENTTMIDIMTRHYPELSARLATADNAFKPWPKQTEASCDEAVAKLDDQGFWGTTKYDGKEREVVTLFSQIPNEENAFYAVSAEYLDPFTEEGFISDFIRPGERNLRTGETNGYLQELFQWITISKVKQVPGENRFEVLPLKVVNGDIVAINDKSAGSFQLTCTSNLPAGSSMKLEVNGRPITINYEGLKRAAPLGFLSTTWDYEYVPGPYNPGYQQGESIILDLDRRFSRKNRTSTAKFDVTELKGQPIRIFGSFEIRESEKGLYTFVNDVSSSSENPELVEDKIGVFLDVYNAKPLFGTVEFVLIDPANPTGSQMYFEEYENR